MGPKPLYFIGSTPAKDVAPPVGGWTDFVKGSKNRTEIVELLLAEYEDAVTGAGDPPKPHHFFNNHNHLCRVYHFRHFSEHLKDAIKEAREILETEGEYFPDNSVHSPERKQQSSTARAKSKPSRSTSTSQKTRRTQADPPPTPEKTPNEMNMHPLQSKEEVEDQSPHTQVQLATDQFPTGNHTQRFVINIHPSYDRDSTSVERDSDNHRAVVIKFYGHILSDPDIADRIYTNGNFRIQGGDHDGHQVSMVGSEAGVVAHVNHHSRKISYEGGQRRNGDAYQFLVIEADKDINNFVRWEILVNHTDPREKLLILDVMHSDAPPLEFAAFTKNDMDITQQNQGHQGRRSRRNTGGYNRPPPPGAPGGGFQGQGGARGNGPPHGGYHGGQVPPPPPPPPAAGGTCGGGNYGGQPPPGHGVYHGGQGPPPPPPPPAAGGGNFGQGPPPPPPPPAGGISGGGNYGGQGQPPPPPGHGGFFAGGVHSYQPHHSYSHPSGQSGQGNHQQYYQPPDPSGSSNVYEQQQQQHYHSPNTYASRNVYQQQQSPQRNRARSKSPMRGANTSTPVKTNSPFRPTQNTMSHPAFTQYSESPRVTFAGISAPNQTQQNNGIQPQPSYASSDAPVYNSQPFRRYPEARHQYEYDDSDESSKEENNEDDNDGYNHTRRANRNAFAVPNYVHGNKQTKVTTDEDSHSLSLENMSVSSVLKNDP